MGKQKEREIKREGRYMKVYYNPRLDLIGLGITNLGVVKIAERENFYLVMGKDWTLIGEL